MAKDSFVLLAASQSLKDCLSRKIWVAAIIDECSDCCGYRGIVIVCCHTTQYYCCITSIHSSWDYTHTAFITIPFIMMRCGTSIASGYEANGDFTFKPIQVRQIERICPNI
jgi:hypothetical protein